jgi:hypothetical protein
MKYLIVIGCLIILTSCHKDSNTTPSTKPTQPAIGFSHPQDTATLFFKASGWKEQQVFKSSHIVSFVAYDSLNLKDTVYDPPIADFQTLTNVDSAILYVYNNGWKRLYAYGNALAALGGLYITTYPNDSLVYNADGSGQTPVLSNGEGGRCFVQLMYQTHSFYNNSFNDTVPSNLNIYFKVFIKPNTSTL